MFFLPDILCVIIQFSKSFILRIALKMKSRITVYYSQKYLSPLFIFPSAVSVYFVICYNCPRFAFLFNCSSFKVPVVRKQRLPSKYASSFNAHKAITSLQCNPSCLPMTHRDAVCKKKKNNRIKKLMVSFCHSN